jgi:outer membrane protein assembly factor BamB
MCGKENPRAEYASRTVVVAPAPERGFTAADLFGEWLQHRADASHSGITPAAIGTPGARWTYAVGGELRASVAVAGNQVFIGAHGNGELVALTLDSGRVGFRIRVPNWVHHEPVVTTDLVIVPFGNSEPIEPGGAQLGSAPSGIAAYERRTGIERWRRYTNTSVMVSPVVRDSIVAAVTHEGDVIAWRIADGKELWRTRLARRSPMANPLLADSVLFVGVELAELCALDVRTGHLLYCHEVASDGWGAGHSSPTLAGSTVLFSYHTRTSGFWLRALAGIAKPTTHGDAMLVALDAASGRERWRVNLGRGVHDVVGHIAGTPVVVGKTAYVNAPSSGRVVAVQTDSGRVLWSSDVRPARGSVLVTNGAVLSASSDGQLVVLDAATGKERCRQKLPANPDRAGLTLAGNTGILTLRNGLVVARPIGDWIACRAQD